MRLAQQSNHIRNLLSVACFALFLNGCASHSTEPKKPKLPTISRYLAITVCYKNQKDCIGPTVKNLENSNIELHFEPYSKTADKGVTAQNEMTHTDYGVPFKSEIRVTKKDGSDDYNIYAMLRSGEGTKREAIVKTVKAKDLAQLERFELQDEPIKFKTKEHEGSLQAELVVGTALPITN